MGTEPGVGLVVPTFALENRDDREPHKAITIPRISR